MSLMIIGDAEGLIAILKVPLRSTTKKWFSYEENWK